MAVQVQIPPDQLYSCAVCGELRRYPHEANKADPLCRCAADAAAAEKQPLSEAIRASIRRETVL